MAVSEDHGTTPAGGWELVERLTVADAIERYRHGNVSRDGHLIEIEGVLTVFSTFCVLKEERQSDTGILIEGGSIDRHLFFGRVSENQNHWAGGHRYRPGSPNYHLPALLSAREDCVRMCSEPMFPVRAIAIECVQFASREGLKDLELQRPLATPVEAELLAEGGLVDLLRLSDDLYPRLLLQPHWFGLFGHYIQETREAAERGELGVCRAKAEELQVLMDRMVGFYQNGLVRYEVPVPFGVPEVTSSEPPYL